MNLTASGHTHRNIDGIVLTKFDTINDKVGAALSMVSMSCAPVMFVSCGQTCEEAPFFCNAILSDLEHPQSTHHKILLQTSFAETFVEILNLQRTLLQREIQCNPIIHSLYSSSCSHMAAFFLVLAQKLPHLMGQSSITCTLMANLIVYLELHLLCSLIAVIEGVLELIGSH